MGKARKPINRSLPRYMRVRRGLYSLMHPVTGKEHGLGRDRAAAIEAWRRIMNDSVEQVAPRPPLTADDIRRDAISTERFCGVYVLLKDDEILYVGQSCNVHLRIWNHMKTKKLPFNRYHIIPCPRASLQHMEAVYIRALRPSRNKDMMPGRMVNRMILPDLPATQESP